MEGQLTGDYNHNYISVPSWTCTTRGRRHGTARGRRHGGDGNYYNKGETTTTRTTTTTSTTATATRTTTTTTTTITTTTHAKQRRDNDHNDHICYDGYNSDNHEL